MTQTSTQTTTYTTTDIEAVVRRITADILMIASSTGAVTEERALKWANDSVVVK